MNETSHPRRAESSRPAGFGASPPAAQLSLKMGTYKPANVCDIPDTAGAGRAYCICSMAGLPIDTENHLTLSTREATSFMVIFGRDPQACAA